MQVYTAREEQSKIKYDALSILIIFIMVFFSIGMYALTSTGVIERIAWMLESSIVPADIPSQRMQIIFILQPIIPSSEQRCTRILIARYHW